MFKKGDVVVCTNLINKNQDLVKIGGVYTVARVTHGREQHLYLKEEKESRWSSSQFELYMMENV